MVLKRLERALNSLNVNFNSDKSGNNIRFYFLLNLPIATLKHIEEKEPREKFAS